MKWEKSLNMCIVVLKSSMIKFLNSESVTEWKTEYRKTALASSIHFLNLTDCNCYLNFLAFSFIFWQSSLICAVNFSSSATVFFVFCTWDTFNLSFLNASSSKIHQHSDKLCSLISQTEHSETSFLKLCASDSDCSFVLILFQDLLLFLDRAFSIFSVIMASEFFFETS